MTSDELQKRTKVFALRVMKLTDVLTSTMAARELGRQLVRSAMSVSANYRAARRARSRKEFLAKIGVVAEEADESQHWLELVKEAGLVPSPRMKQIIDEAGQLVAIFSTIQRTTRNSGTKRNGA